MENPIALFDMDNTLFDYESKLIADLNFLKSPCEPEIKNAYENNSWIRNRRILIQSVPGWWRTLPKFKLGWDIYEIAHELNFETHIITKGPQKHSHAWSEKVECIKDHFANKVNIDIVGKDKTKVYGRVFVDDYPNYVLGWLKYRPRGLAIVPAHYYNKDINHPNLIRYDGNNLHEVQMALKAAKQRKQGEHWKLYL